ncbi:hypothetical protein RND71_043056 [Anisodus tanguticus]|uniref:Uncharacterized protein n=1 Tax=Anisodus tanguticus TaxID=243964 RepID=A0AAE1QSN0_9SOLA|nr:hypothetical protein RND71_043056 [Anisodus tanguticus]
MWSSESTRCRCRDRCWVADGMTLMVQRKRNRQGEGRWRERRKRDPWSPALEAGSVCSPPVGQSSCCSLLRVEAALQGGDKEDRHLVAGSARTPAMGGEGTGIVLLVPALALELALLSVIAIDGSNQFQSGEIRRNRSCSRTIQFNSQDLKHYRSNFTKLESIMQNEDLERLFSYVIQKLLGPSTMLMPEEVVHAVGHRDNKVPQAVTKHGSGTKFQNADKPKRRLLPVSSILLKDIGSINFKDENEKPKGVEAEKKGASGENRTQGSISLLRLLKDNLAV